MNVFVSRPNWVAPEHDRGLTRFLGTVDAMGLSARTLGSSDAPEKSPLDDVLRIMAECSGAIVLGYPQIHLTKGQVKGREAEGDVVLATEWNHMEGCLAYARALPLLVIHDQSVSRGIFDRGALNQFLFSDDFTKEDWSGSERILRALRDFKRRMDGKEPAGSAVAKPEARPTIKKGTYFFKDANGSEDGPFCTGCWDTKAQKVRVTPLPRAFAAIASHKCPSCDATYDARGI